MILLPILVFILVCVTCLCCKHLLVTCFATKHLNRIHQFSIFWLFSWYQESLIRNTNILIYLIWNKGVPKGGLKQPTKAWYDHSIQFNLFQCFLGGHYWICRKRIGQAALKLAELQKYFRGFTNFRPLYGGHLIEIFPSMSNLLTSHFKHWISHGCNFRKYGMFKPPPTLAR